MIRVAHGEVALKKIRNYGKMMADLGVEKFIERMKMWKTTTNEIG